MPVDRNHSRFSTSHGNLGTATIWDCPGCGKKNEGRRPEQGCLHCGAGDPNKNPGKLEVPHVNAPGAAARDQEYPPPPTPAPRISQEAYDYKQTIEAKQQLTRVLRLIEYVGRPEDIAGTLQRSLVGSLKPGMVQITATIVDDCSPRQEDLLMLARKQPGVWMANQDAMAGHDRPVVETIPYHVAAQRAMEYFEGEHLKQQRPHFVTGMTTVTQPTVPPPPTGPQWTPQQDQLATLIFQAGGPVLCNTLALALSNVAADVDGEQFLSYQDCLQLANALVHQLPEGWGDPPPAEGVTSPVTGPEQDEARQQARQRAAAIAAGSVPTAVFRGTDNEGPGQ